MIFISPPFGNYISLPKCRSIKGSFTLEPRGGLIVQIFRTLRYSFLHCLQFECFPITPVLRL